MLGTIHPPKPELASQLPRPSAAAGQATRVDSALRAVSSEDVGESWLRMPPIRPPGGLLLEPQRNPLAFGHEDLMPGGLGGVGGGGMLLGPNNPMFSARYHEERAGRIPHPMPSNPITDVPPGARFDPIGPIGARPGGRGRERFGAFGTGDPDPDHLPPPGYGDMFM